MSFAKRRKGKGSLDRLGDVIPRIYPAPEELDTARVFACWLEVFPSRVIGHARPVKLSRGTLEVNVTSASWANELSFLEREMVQKLSLKEPHGGVRRIRFRVGPLPELPERAREKKKRRAAIPLANLPTELAEALAKVHDDDLRDAILSAAVTGLGQVEDVE